MVNDTNVPYMGVSEGQGHDLPDRRRLDAPWFCRPDPLYFPGYMIPYEGLSYSLLGGNMVGANGIFEEIVKRNEEMAQPSP